MDGLIVVVSGCGWFLGFSERQWVVVDCVMVVVGRCVLL